MEIPLFEASNGACPYLKGKEWLSYLTHADRLDEYLYEALLNRGFRRSGHIFYQNQCKGCDACIPVRLSADSFEPTKSQRKVWRKNQDLRLEILPARFDEEAYKVYDAFTKSRYNASATAEEFQQFLVKTAVDTQMVKYYLEDQIVAVGWLDILANSVSSVYFAFDPSQAKRSLGTFSVMKEIEICREMGKDYLHLGFWVADCQAMAYKSKFYPHQFLIDGEWCDPIRYSGQEPNLPYEQ
ncbi:MAG: arginyltransferase [bacterium]|nr:arginyltransferase [bacterium]